MSCINVFFEDNVVIEGDDKGLGFRLLGKDSVSRAAFENCAGGEDNISPVTVMSAVRVVGVGDLKSKARVDSIESE